MNLSTITKSFIEVSLDIWIKYIENSTKAGIDKNAIRTFFNNLKSNM